MSKSSSDDPLAGTLLNSFLTRTNILDSMNEDNYFVTNFSVHVPTRKSLLEQGNSLDFRCTFVGPCLDVSTISVYIFVRNEIVLLNLMGSKARRPKQTAAFCPFSVDMQSSIIVNSCLLELCVNRFVTILCWHAIELNNQFTIHHDGYLGIQWRNVVLYISCFKLLNIWNIFFSSVTGN